MWRLVIHTVLLAVLVQATASANQKPGTRTSVDSQQRLTTSQNLTSMPLTFTENQGQWNERVKFRANAGGATMWFAPDGAYYQFTRRIAADISDVTLRLSRSDVSEEQARLRQAQPDLRADRTGGRQMSTSTPDTYPAARTGRDLYASVNPARAGNHSSEPDSVETMMLKVKFVGAKANPNMVGVNMLEYKCNYLYCSPLVTGLL